MIKLIVGLGNPGLEYELTRHNIGWIFLDTWEKLSTATWQKKFKGIYTSFSFKSEKVFVLKPETFMNLSGQSVLPLIKFFKIKPSEILVIHDEVDLEFGQVQLKNGGGLAGHNGLKSISQCLGTNDYYRLRMGVGKPARGSVSSWVLGKFPIEQTNDLEKVLNESAKCLDILMTSGFNKAASSINKKRYIRSYIMGLNIGIVGLPNVGKSTIFQAITSAPAEAANYPFCTIEPNVGTVQVPDSRMQQITNLIKPQKVIPAVIEFVDIAGLVKGASKGEGLGNQFLGHIRQVQAIAHVVRCFEDSDIIHVDGKIDPVSDIEVINIELAFADLESVTKRLSNIEKNMKSQDKQVKQKALQTKPILEELKKVLEDGLPARSLNLDSESVALINDLHLITLKKMIYVCNVDEAAIFEDNDYVKGVREIAEKENAEVVKICGQVEAEIAQLDSIEEKKEFLSEMGLEESGLDQLIKKGYKLLDLETYFTAGEKEVRAWTFKHGMKAPQCAGIIHTDFEKGFIKAEVYHCEDLFSAQTEGKLKETGKLRIEGKDYLVKDGDVMHFRFNV